MISYIHGPLMEKFEDSVVVEAGGIGYRIFVPTAVLASLPPNGEEVKIYTYFQVREDAMVLYGFLNRQDLDIFKKLLGVNGVGPKSALGVLSALNPDEFRMAVVTGDAKRITKAPGIGGKTAQRIILEEAVEALTALGYSAGEASGAVKKVEIADGMTAEDVLKKALKYLAFL